MIAIRKWANLIDKSFTHPVRKIQQITSNGLSIAHRYVTVIPGCTGITPWLFVITKWVFTVVELVLQIRVGVAFWEVSAQ